MFKTCLKSTNKKKVQNFVENIYFQFLKGTNIYCTIKLGYNKHSYNDHGYDDHGYNDHGYSEGIKVVI